MKGIILAGGRATRLYPVTRSTCKQLLPLYDKPMVYYPLSVLMLSGIREILIISTAQDIGRFRDLFSDGAHLGLDISYAVQEEPRGIAEAFIIGEDFTGDDSVCLILGDNVFFGHGLSGMLKDSAREAAESAVVFGYYTRDPERYGVVEFDAGGKVISIEEKPAMPKSNYAVCGIYFYPPGVSRVAGSIRPSARGELEITDVNRVYLDKGLLKVNTMGRGFAWLDTGTHDSLLDGAHFIKTVEERQGLKIGCIEEVAYRMGFIDDEALLLLARDMNSAYGEYLLRVLNEEGKIAV